MEEPTFDAKNAIEVTNNARHNRDMLTQSLGEGYWAVAKCYIAEAAIRGNTSKLVYCPNRAFEVFKRAAMREGYQIHDESYCRTYGPLPRNYHWVAWM